MMSWGAHKVEKKKKKKKESSFHLVSFQKHSVNSRSKDQARPKLSPRIDWEPVETNPSKWRLQEKQGMGTVAWWKEMRGRGRLGKEGEHLQGNQILLTALNKSFLNLQLWKGETWEVISCSAMNFILPAIDAAQFACSPSRHGQVWSTGLSQSNWNSLGCKSGLFLAPFLC